MGSHYAVGERSGCHGEAGIKSPRNESRRLTEALEMTPVGDAHECDLFLLSSHTAYVGDRILPTFARKGSRNIHGWGIGSYTGGRARVMRQSEPASGNDGPSTAFA